MAVFSLLYCLHRAAERGYKQKETRYGLSKQSLVYTSSRCRAAFAFIRSLVSAQWSRSFSSAFGLHATSCRKHDTHPIVSPPKKHFSKET